MIGLKHPRIKDEKHLAFIRQLPCAVCANNIQTEAAHLRAGDEFYGKRPTGMGEKPDDKWTLPLCWEHHQGDQHRGNEMAFWRRHGINPFVLALTLYAHSGDHELADQVLSAQRRAA